MSAMLQTISQQRGQHALTQIQAYIKNHAAQHEKQKELLSYINSMGPMILMSGFGQTCAFYRSNKKEEHQSALGMLADWLESGDRIYAHGGKERLMEKIVAGNASDYQLAQAEALAYLDWLKKFAKAFLEVKAEGKEDGDATPTN